MKRLVCLLRDLMKTLILGGIISIGIAIVIGVIALLVNKGNIKTTIEVIRSALLITGSFGLLLAALKSVAAKGLKSESPLKYIDQWKEKFKVFSYKVVLIFSSIIILLCGGIIDWFLFYKL